MVCDAVPVVVNHSVLCSASDCESWCAKLSQWLYIIVCYAGPAVCIMVCYSGLVVVNHGVSC